MNIWLTAGLVASAFVPVTQSNWNTTGYAQGIVQQAMAVEQTCQTAIVQLVDDLEQWLGITPPGVDTPSVHSSSPANILSSMESRLRPDISGSRVRHLPNLSWSYSKRVGQLQVSAGDRGVSHNAVDTAATIIERDALPILQTNLGRVPSRAHVVLFSSKQTYGRALERAGMSSQDVASAVDQTGGITVGQDVWIPLYAVPEVPDLADVLTHELTHVALNEQGVGNVLPTWLDEGTAWFDGLAAQSKEDPGSADRLRSDYNRQLLDAVRSGRLLPVSANEHDILSASYNVEWEDYLAVENLIQQKGTAKYRNFLTDATSMGVNASFDKQYGESVSGYATEFDQWLSSQS